MPESSELTDELIRIHHAAYREDIPFWIAKTAENSRVLELGCSYGRVTLPLLEAGRRMTGLDQDWNALLYLKSQIRFCDQVFHGQIYLLQANMLNFRIANGFDSIIIPCNTYSSFSSTERKQILDNLVGMLHAGGFFITSVPNPGLITSLYKLLSDSDSENEAELETTFKHPISGFPIQVSSRISLAEYGVCWEWIYDILLPDGSVERYCRSNEHHLSSLEIYLQELQDVGLEVDAPLGGFDGTGFDQDAPHLILVAKST